MEGLEGSETYLVLQLSDSSLLREVTDHLVNRYSVIVVRTVKFLEDLRPTEKSDSEAAPCPACFAALISHRNI